MTTHTNYRSKWMNAFGAMILGVVAAARISMTDANTFTTQYYNNNNNVVSTLDPLVGDLVAPE
jgi:hypothetical protein